MRILFIYALDRSSAKAPDASSRQTTQGYARAHRVSVAAGNSRFILIPRTRRTLHLETALLVARLLNSIVSTMRDFVDIVARLTDRFIAPHVDDLCPCCMPEDIRGGPQY